jgi:hypothetical protein
MLKDFLAKLMMPFTSILLASTIYAPYMLKLKQAFQQIQLSGRAEAFGFGLQASAQIQMLVFTNT